MKKKILFVTNHFRFSNGVASVLRSLIDNMDLDKYDISLLAIYDYNKEFAKPIENKIHVVKGFGTYFRGFDKFVNLIPSRLLYKLFIKEKYDVEIAFQFGVPTKMISYSSNPHKICWMHTFDSKMILRRYYERFPLVVNVAKIGMEKMIREGFAESKCDYCYNIIDEDNILGKLDEEIEVARDHSLVVVTVARLAPDKAFIRYLTCIRNMLSKVGENADIEFWIIGDGSERDKMEEFVSSNNLSRHVKLLGQQKNPYKYMDRADCYFCCSYREGFSTACQEAAIIGLPVISVNVDGAQELFELQETGCVIDNNEDAIVKELTDMVYGIEDIKKWKSIAQKSKYKFKKSERIKKIENIIDKY